MYAVLQDRIFWIYFIITLFFIILGIWLILSSDDPNMIIISILWFFSSITLIILIYHISIKWSPKDSDTMICVIDNNSGCFEAGNRVWLFINILFIILLIMSVLWAAELKNIDGSPLRTMSGILIILGGLILSGLIGYEHMYTIPFWIAVSYILIWFGLSFYVITT